MGITLKVLGYGFAVIAVLAIIAVVRWASRQPPELDDTPAALRRSGPRDLDIPKR
jgi:hypothetical protein